jgi:hypothetical protein
LRSAGGELDSETLAQRIVARFDGVNVVEASGDWFFFHDLGRNLPPDRRFPFATLVTGDRYDAYSNLDRPGVFRLNVGVSPATFRALLGPTPADGDPEAAAPGYDFTALDRIMPHPVYGNMFWVCVLNPSAAAFARMRPLLAEAYERAANRRTKTRPSEPS